MAMPVRTAVLVAVILLGCLPGAASAARSPFAGSSPRIDLLPDGASTWRHDHESRLLVAGTAPDRRPALMDVSTGARTPLTLPDERCSVAALRAATVVAECPTDPADSMFETYVGTVPATTWTRLPVDTTHTSDGSEWADDIGARWIRMSAVGYHYAYDYYVSRADGRRVPDDAVGAHAIPDLDAPEVAAPLCAPLVRRVVPSDAFPLDTVFAAYRYDDGWGVQVGKRAKGTHPLALQRCGRPPRTPFCTRACDLGQLEHGLLTWWSAGRSYVRDLRSGRTTRIRIPHRTDVLLTIVGRTILAEAGGRVGRVRLP